MHVFARGIVASYVSIAESSPCGTATTKHERSEIVFKFLDLVVKFFEDFFFPNLLRVSEHSRDVGRDIP